MKSFRALRFIKNSASISKNRPEMIRETPVRRPKVDPRYTSSQAYVAPKGAISDGQGDLLATFVAALLQMFFFFAGEEKCLHLFFRPIGATVDLEKC